MILGNWAEVALDSGVGAVVRGSVVPGGSGTGAAVERGVCAEVGGVGVAGVGAIRFARLAVPVQFPDCDDHPDDKGSAFR